MFTVALAVVNFDFDRIEDRVGKDYCSHIGMHDGQTSAALTRLSIA